MIGLHARSWCEEGGPWSLFHSWAFFKKSCFLCMTKLFLYSVKLWINEQVFLLGKSNSKVTQNRRVWFYLLLIFLYQVGKVNLNPSWNKQCHWITTLLLIQPPNLHLHIGPCKCLMQPIFGDIDHLMALICRFELYFWPDQSDPIYKFVKLVVVLHAMTIFFFLRIYAPKNWLKHYP